MSEILKINGNVAAVDWQEALVGRPAPQAIVTSPPYWAKRRYPIPDTWWGGDRACRHKPSGNLPPPRIRKEKDRGVSGIVRGLEPQQWESKPSQQCGFGCGAWLGQLGQEPTPHLFVEHLADLMHSLPLHDTGIMWVNLGDTYIAGKGRSGKADPQDTDNRRAAGKTLARGIDQASGGFGKMAPGDDMRIMRETGLKQKDLALVPERFALAMQERGWWVRSKVIWHKSNGLPESVTDRPSGSHEVVWMLTKSKRYRYHKDNFLEPCAESSKRRELGGRSDIHKYSSMPDAINKGRRNRNNDAGAWESVTQMRGLRNVWTLPTAQNRKGHIAPMPTAVVERCILVSTQPGEWVLDPFAGTGTTLYSAKRLGRNGIGVELDGKFEEFTADLESMTASIFPAP